MLPTSWQLQADPTWVEARAPPSSTEVNRLRPGCLGLWGSFHPPGSSSFQTGSLICGPSSQLGTVLAPGSGLSSPQGTWPGPRL